MFLVTNCHISFVFQKLCFNVISAEEEEQEEEAETDIMDRLSDISFASGNSSYVVRNTDTESENEECPVLKKPKPKHKWFVVPEILNRYVLYYTTLLC